MALSQITLTLCSPFNGFSFPTSVLGVTMSAVPLFLYTKSTLIESSRDNECLVVMYRITVNEFSEYVHLHNSYRGLWKWGTQGIHMVNDFTKVRQGRCVRAVSGTQEFCMQNHLYCTAFSNVSKTLRVRHRHMVIHQTGSPAKVEFCTRHYATYLACIISENCDYRDEPDFYSLSIKYLVHGYISIPESYSMYVAILTSMYFAFGESPSSPNL